MDSECRIQSREAEAAAYSVLRAVWGPALILSLFRVNSLSTDGKVVITDF